MLLIANNIASFKPERAMIRYFILCLILFFLPLNCETALSQSSLNLKNSPKNNVDTNSIKVKVKHHSPKKAALFSAILPGLGQAYNKKYWKIPIIYAGVGTLVYFVNLNHKEYKKFREAYIYVSTGDSSYTDNDYVNKYSKEALLQGRNYYRGNLELTYILSGVLYILNIIDATVDAHLFEYDISGNLSMKLEPGYSRDMIFGQPATTIKLSLRF